MRKREVDEEGETQRISKVASKKMKEEEEVKEEVKREMSGSAMDTPSIRGKGKKGRKQRALLEGQFDGPYWVSERVRERERD